MTIDDNQELQRLEIECHQAMDAAWEAEKKLNEAILAMNERPISVS